MSQSAEEACVVINVSGSEIVGWVLKGKRDARGRRASFLSCLGCQKSEKYMEDKGPSTLTGDESASAHARSTASLDTQAEDEQQDNKDQDGCDCPTESFE